MDARLQEILERCYAVIGDGDEPDLDELCAEAPELRGRVARLLERERQALQACTAPPKNTQKRAALRGGEMPDRLGDFTVIEPIGVGGMSMVFRARQESLNREVALKVLRTGTHTSPAARLRFAREASITASLEHPHIVPVFAAGEQDGQVYLAMKLLRGRSLDHTDARSPHDVARIGVEVASALAAAHEVGVVHRDVKPANIVVEQGRAFVVDFGLAAFADRASVLTQPEATPGTLIYLPPEVAGRRSSSLDARADIYGLGATLYELLAGRPPFDADNPVRALQQILHESPRSLGLRGRDHDLEVLVMRALEKSPLRRFQRAEQFGEELQRFLDGRAILTRPPNLLIRSARRVGQHPVVSALVAVILLLAVLLGVQVLLQHQRSERVLQQAIASTVAAIDDGQLADAQVHLQELAALTDGAAAADSLQARWRAERDLQLCTLAMGSPLLPALRDYLDELVQRVATQHPLETRSARCRAVLAMAEWGRATPSAGMHREFPRTAAVLSGQRDATVARSMLAALPSAASPSVLDHVLVAAALRSLGVAEAEIEGELRRAPIDQRSPVLLFSLATSLEAQGRYREAYEAALQLLLDPVCARSARWTLARLAATLGEAEVARRLRQDAGSEPDDDLLLLDLAYPSELQVLAESDVGAFWQRWRQAPERCRAMPHYWLLAGYVMSSEAMSAEELAEARGHFEVGLTCSPDRLSRASLEVAICQLDWGVVTMELEESVGAVSSVLLRRVETLAQQAERLWQAAESDRLPVTYRGDALLVAAQCRVELGQWPAAAAHFDRAADLGAVDAMAVFVTLVAQWAVAIEFGDGAAGHVSVPAGLRLEREARVAVERARRLLGDAATGRSLDVDQRARVAAAQLLCAASLGDAVTARVLCQAWPALASAESGELGELGERVVADGGVLLQGVATDDVLRSRLLGMATELLRALDCGQIEAGSVAAIVPRWRSLARVQALLDGDEAAALRAGLDALEQRLRG